MTPARRRLLLLLLILAGVINYADRSIIAVLKPLLQHDLHWSDQDYGLMTSIFQFAAAISYLGVGWFVDRVGLKWANPLAVAAWSLASMAHAVVRGFAQFVVVRVALGATEAVYTPAAIKTVAIVYRPEERGLALGALNAANTLGAIITPLIVPALALALGWRAAFILIGLTGLIWAAAWFPLMFNHIDPGHKSATIARTTDTARGRFLTETLRDRRAWAVIGAKALSDQVWWFLLFWTPDLFHRVFHLSIKAAGAPLAAVFTCAAVGSLGGGYASGRLMRGGVSLDRARKGVMLACALLVTPVALVLYVKNYWLAVGLLGVALAAHQGFSSNLFAVITDIIPSDRVGSVTSLAAFAGNMAGMTILALVGFSLSHGGGYGPFFALTSVAYLLALAWLQGLAPRLTGADPLVSNQR
jgi:ACS family hexuronate transporter-like MFS transporter